MAYASIVFSILSSFYTICTYLFVVDQEIRDNSVTKISPVIDPVNVGDNSGNEDSPYYLEEQSL